MAKEKERWIQGAVRHKGSLTRAAHKHGKSVLAEAHAESKSPNKKIAARGRLALRFKGKAKHGNIKKNGHKKTHHKHLKAKG